MPKRKASEKTEKQGKRARVEEKEAPANEPVVEEQVVADEPAEEEEVDEVVSKEAASTGKQPVEADVEEEDEEDDEEQSDEEISYEAKGDEKEDDIINIDFDFTDPVSLDWWTIKLMVKKYIDDEKFRCEEFSHLIADQACVGTMIKADGTEGQPLAFITALNYHQNKASQCMQQIKKFVLKKASAPKDKQRLEKYFDSKKLGLIIQQRFINLPPQLVPQMHRSLFEDIDWATKNEEPELRGNYEFDNFLLIARCYDLSRSGAIKKKGKQKRKESNPKLAQGTYLRFEEEFYQNEATLSFKFPAAQSSDGVSDMSTLPQSHVVMVIPKSKIAKVLARLAQLEAEGLQGVPEST